MTSTHSDPPMDPNTSEATQKQLDLAREQGEAYGRALTHMTTDVAHDGGEQGTGQYRIGYAVEDAEGMYEWEDGELVWHEPGESNLTSRSRSAAPATRSTAAAHRARGGRVPGCQGGARAGPTAQPPDRGEWAPAG
jgi:hypothetical protein